MVHLTCAIIGLDGRGAQFSNFLFLFFCHFLLAFNLLFVKINKGKNLKKNNTKTELIKKSFSRIIAYEYGWLSHYQLKILKKF